MTPCDTVVFGCPSASLSFWKLIQSTLHSTLQHTTPHHSTQSLTLTPICQQKIKRILHQSRWKSATEKKREREKTKNGKREKKVQPRIKWMRNTRKSPVYFSQFRLDKVKLRARRRKSKWELQTRFEGERHWHCQKGIFRERQGEREEEIYKKQEKCQHQECEQISLHPHI